LVDDLSKDEAFKLYEGFGFEDKGLVWEWIGGKVGDMIRLYEKKKQGYSEEEGLRNMLKDEVGRLSWMLKLIKDGEKEGPSIEDLDKTLRIFKRSDKVKHTEVESKVLKFLIEENILFYNPVEGTVCPQGRLIHRAIEEVIS